MTKNLHSVSSAKINFWWCQVMTNLKLHFHGFIYNFVIISREAELLFILGLYKINFWSNHLIKMTILKCYFDRSIFDLINFLMQRSVMSDNLCVFIRCAVSTSMWFVSWILCLVIKLWLNKINFWLYHWIKKWQF